MRIIKTGQTRSDARNKFNVLVSNEDYKLLSQFNWQAQTNGTVYTRINGRCVQMHRMIMGAPEIMEVDHINGNRLDNRRENLRLCNSSQNKCNRGPRKDNKTGFKGVIWNASREKFQTHIKIPGGKYKFLGAYSDVKEAALAYNKAALKYHGEFAYVNKL